MSGKIFVTGDMHGDLSYNDVSSKSWPEGRLLDRDDYLIVAGDMGILWGGKFNNPLEKYLKKWYGEEKPWTTLFVDGNHENHHRLRDLPTMKMFGDEVGVVCENVYHLKRGRVYTINGSKIFTMGGATSWDKYRRATNVSWWEEEVPAFWETDLALENLANNDWEVDYVITHTLPRESLSVFGFSNNKGGEYCPLTGFLDHVARELTYKDWYAGHFHCDMTRGKFHILYHDVVQIN